MENYFICKTGLISWLVNSRLFSYVWIQNRLSLSISSSQFVEWDGNLPFSFLQFFFPKLLSSLTCKIQKWDPLNKRARKDCDVTTLLLLLNAPLIGCWTAGELVWRLSSVYKSIVGFYTAWDVVVYVCVCGNCRVCFALLIRFGRCCFISLYLIFCVAIVESRLVRSVFGICVFPD